MYFYQELLDSYQLLKKRKFRIDEGKNTQEAETRAKYYIQLAVSHAITDHYIVSIPELGANAKIYVAKNGKQAGNVVVDNVLSMYPLAVATGSGEPLKVPAYFQFVGKFNKILGQDSMPKQETPELGLMGSAPIGPNPSVEGLYKAATKLSTLAADKKLFSLARSMASPTWMQSGPMQDFQELQRKIVGPDPFSLESKILNATKIIQEPMFNSDISIPISDTDKKLVSDSFNEFIDKFDKLYKGTFTETDALWVHQHIVNDKSGFWIKDPLLLNSGISLSWRYSNSDPQHGFFRYLLLTYNKLYKQWAEEHNTSPNYPILDMNKSHFANLDSYDLGSIRGKTAEELRIAINSLSNGDKEAATEQLSIIANEYGQKIQQAYSMVAPYQEGYSAADSSLINSLGFLKALETTTGGNLDPIIGVLPKLTWVEQHGILKRKPYAINSISTNISKLGQVSDLEEYYNEGELFTALTTKHKFSPEEANQLDLGNKLNIGLKTYLNRNEISLSHRNLMQVLTSIVDYKNNPFILNSTNEFGLSPHTLVEHTDKLEKISKLLNTYSINSIRI